MGALRQLRLVREEEPPESDAELVAQVLAGKRSAGAELYKRHAQAAGSLATRLLASRTDVEDILHDSFLAALTGLHRLRDPSAFRSWLLRIVVLNVRQKIRRRRIARRLGLDRTTDDATLELLAAPTVGAEERAELSLVHQELERMSAQHRITWMLAKVEGYAINEIAMLTSCSPTTVKRRLKYANERMDRWVRLDPGAQR